MVMNIGGEKEDGELRCSQTGRRGKKSRKVERIKKAETARIHWKGQGGNESAK